MPDALVIRGARKSYGPVVALDGADLDLRRGELLALLGPNGAGKTTLVRAVAGRVRLDEGSVALAPDARLGLVPQEIALYPLLAARENLEVFGRLHGLQGTVLSDRVRWALDWTGLASREKDLVRGFSGGMKRRLNVACGVLHRPDLVLLDEPTVGVDPQSRERLWEMLDGLKAEGASLLLTTHQLDEAQGRCERIVILDHGKSLAEGTLEELAARTVGRTRRVTVRLGDGRVQTFEDVEDVAVETPSLQAVFLHLTGRELRE